MRSLRYQITRVVVSVVLGVVTTVAVAWAGAFVHSSFGGPTQAWHSYRGGVLTAFQGNESALATELSGTTFSSNKTMALSFAREDSPLPTWAPVGIEVSTTLQEPLNWSCVATGWPMRCMFTGWEEPAFVQWSPDQIAPQVIVRTRHYGVEVSAELALPLLINPLGFAVNTAIAAAIWWLLLIALSTTRRFFRHRRGACLRCGYGPLPSPDACCPECGSIRGAHSVATALTLPSA